MRNISDTALEMIQRVENCEPVMIVQIWWSGLDYLPIKYCDKKYEVEGLVGRLLSVSGIDDIVDITTAAASTNLSVVLDDAVGDLKQIFNQQDIHKVYVAVLQWFDGIPLTDAFTLFEGEISSPIVWDEGARTLGFDVVSQIEDREVGYSFEEADVTHIPVQLVGQSVPLIFGRVSALRPVPLNLTPSLVISRGFGIVDFEQWDAELAELAAQIQKCYDNARSAWQQGLAEAIIAGQFKPIFPGDVGDPEAAEAHDQAAHDLFVQSDQFMTEFYNISLERGERLLEYEAQKAISVRADGGMPVPVYVNMNNFPRVRPGQAYHTFKGQFANYVADITVSVNTPSERGKILQIHNIELLVDTKIKVGTNVYGFAPTGGVIDEYERDGQGQKFVWIDGGTEFKIFAFPRTFVVGMGPVDVVNVWAESKYGRRVVPTNLYTVNTGAGLNATTITFPIALEALDGDWSSGSIEVDCATNLTNAVDIMAYVITNFSGLEADTASFLDVRPAVYDCNFALTNRINVVNFLKELAFQSRCAIWMKSKRVYIKNLATASASTATIVDSDITVATLNVTCTPTEQLVTKFVALWRFDQGSEENKTILRYNIKRYGVLEQTYNFWAYNQYQFVEKVAEFWSIRYANTWKLCSFKLSLNHLRIEMFDTITLDLTENIVSNGPVDCIVQRATFDSDDDSIALEVWVPIRLGEMTPYVHAFPMDTQTIYPNPTDPNIQTGNPLDGVTFDLGDPYSFPERWQVVDRDYSTQQTGTYESMSSGSYTPADSTPDPIDVLTRLAPFLEDLAWRNSDDTGPSRPAELETFNNKKDKNVKDVAQPTYVQATPNTYFGSIVSTEYVDGFMNAICNVYFQGLTGTATTTRVRIGLIAEDEVLPEGMPLVVHRTIYKRANGKKDANGKTLYDTFAEYWAQPATWVPTVATEE